MDLNGYKCLLYGYFEFYELLLEEKSMRNDKENLIVKLSFEFALEIIEFTELLESLRKYNMANQLFRSGTSIGANIREAQNAESKADFIHKFKIAAKEIDETDYWLSLCEKAPSYPFKIELRNKLMSIMKITTKIIASSKTNSSSNQQIFKSSN
ncbi:MAG: four helix bundle protein [Crocinitomicaceae bacterium]